MHSFFPSSPWGTPGADFAAASSADVFVDLGFGTFVWSTDEMVADVQSWVDDAGSNFGWAILGDGPDGSAKRFGSREHLDPDTRPVLTVEFTAGCSGNGDCDGDGDADLVDFSAFQLCFTGAAGGPINESCECSDFDCDGDVDLVDFSGFQLAFTGPL